MSQFLGYMGERLPNGNHRVTDAAGTDIGQCRITATWKTPRSWVSSTMHQVTVWIGGKTYTARSPGESLHILGRERVSPR